MPLDNKKALIFLHIPKTAGSTFHSVLSARYAKSSTFNVFGSRYSEPEIEAFVNKPLENKNDITLLKGHMPFGLHCYMPVDCHYITFLRKPVERVISQYYYIKKNKMNPLHEAVAGGGMTITEFVSSGIAVGMNNGHCRFLNGDLDAYPFNECDSSLLDNAKQHVKDHFLWLGITERFDESVLVLYELLGWKKLPFYFRENVSHLRKRQDKTTPQEIETISSYNQYDLQLYDYANQLLDTHIQHIPDFAAKLDSFMLENQRMQKRWGWLPDKFHRFVF